MLFVEGGNTVEALNAVDGSLLWRYIRPLPESLHNGSEARMKGLAIYADSLYAPTADGHIVALDLRTGELRWDHAVVTPAQGVRPGLFDGAYFHISGGPLLLRDKVIVGVSLGVNTGGGDFIVALDANSGAEQWRFSTIAHPGQPGSDSWNNAPANERFGSGVWSIGSYDPDLNLVYFGTGKHLRRRHAVDAPKGPEPREQRRALHGLDRGAQCRYRQAVLVLPAHEPGRLGSGLGLRADPGHAAGQWQADQAGGDRGKSAIFDAVNGADGKYAFSKDLGLQNLVASIEPATGRKIIKPDLEPKAGRTDLICPTPKGARSWPTTAFDPASGYLYVPLVDNNCMNYSWFERDGAQIAAGGQDMRLQSRPKPGNDGNFGRIEAIDLKTQRVVWSQRQRAPIASSLLTSAGGLVFSGARDRQLRAYDAADGKVLWQVGLNAAPSSSPATYSVDGVQYLAVIAGGGGAFDAGGRSLTPEIIDPPAGTTLWVFKLPRTAQ
ncbi:MAG: PQQ-binding-like beta-propeller repeat protein [Steroidobacteraceae bacterium]